MTTMNASQTAELLDAQLADSQRREDLVARYVRDQLGEPLLSAFELKMLESPDLQADVALEFDLRDAFRALPTSAYRLAAAEPKRLRVVAVAGIALVAGTLLGTLLPPRGGAPTVGAAAVVALSGLRSGTAVGETEVLIGRDEETTVLRIPAPAVAADSFSLRLVSGDLPSTMLNALKVDSEGNLNVAVPTQRLLAQPLRLQVLDAQGVALGEELRLRFRAK
jgi:hypothetical protein